MRMARSWPVDTSQSTWGALSCSTSGSCSIWYSRRSVCEFIAVILRRVMEDRVGAKDMPANQCAAIAMEPCPSCSHIATRDGKYQRHSEIAGFFSKSPLREASVCRNSTRRRQQVLVRWELDAGTEQPVELL